MKKCRVGPVSAVSEHILDKRVGRVVNPRLSLHGRVECRKSASAERCRREIGVRRFVAENYRAARFMCLKGCLQCGATAADYNNIAFFIPFFRD